MPPTAREPRARDTAPAGEHSGVAAHQVVVRSVVRDRAARSVPKAGGPDVGRHAAAAACDGEGIRVDGQYRTCAGSGCLESKATGRPLELSSLIDLSPAAVAAAGRGRRYALAQAAETLHRLGYRGLRARGFKGRHIEALVAEWRRQGLSEGTMRNRMAHLRWLANKIGKPGIVRKDNASYGIGPGADEPDERRASLR